ncbi:MAG: Fic family protein [Bacteroidetes bacterium]|nr:Fic family protein [Bacteroidota bacterium]
MEIAEKLKVIGQLKASIDGHGKLSSELLKKINYKFRLDWNYYSNTMEGNTLTKDETRSIMIGNITIHGKPIRDVLEMRGHDDAITEILKIGKGELNISEKRIKDIHKAIMHEETDENKAKIGAWKTVDNYILNYKGERFDFVKPEDVAEELHKLINWLSSENEKQDNSIIHPAILAIEFHLKYLTIHPFYDGNGRTARILMNLILISRGYPPIIIKTGDKAKYYQYLADVQGYGGSKDFYYGLMLDLLIRSMEMVDTAIKGGDIEEPDDLEKELKQIDIKLKNEEAKVVRRTPDLVIDVFEQSIKPLFDALYIRLSKFNSFFADFEISTFMDGTGNSGSKSAVDLFLPEYFKRNRVREITINFQWGGFNRAGANTFWLNAQLKIQLEEFDYRINEMQVPERRPGLKKLYSQQLTETEIARIVDETTSDTLLRFKENYKQATGKDL